MPYCPTALVADDPNQATALIKSIAIEHFRARDAYLLDNDSWNIDAGENDVRAINRNDEGVIQFFCRYAEDIQRTESKKNSSFCSESFSRMFRDSNSRASMNTLKYCSKG